MTSAPPRRSATCTRPAPSSARRPGSSPACSATVARTAPARVDEVDVIALGIAGRDGLPVRERQQCPTGERRHRRRRLGVRGRQLRRDAPPLMVGGEARSGVPADRHAPRPRHRGTAGRDHASARRRLPSAPRAPCPPCIRGCGEGSGSVQAPREGDAGADDNVTNETPTPPDALRMVRLAAVGEGWKCNAQKRPARSGYGDTCNTGPGGRGFSRNRALKRRGEIVDPLPATLEEFCHAVART